MSRRISAKYLEFILKNNYAHAVVQAYYLIHQPSFITPIIVHIKEQGSPEEKRHRRIILIRKDLEQRCKYIFSMQTLVLDSTNDDKTFLSIIIGLL